MKLAVLAALLLSATASAQDIYIAVGTHPNVSGGESRSELSLYSLASRTYTLLLSNSVGSQGPHDLINNIQLHRSLMYDVESREGFRIRTDGAELPVDEPTSDFVRDLRARTYRLSTYASPKLEVRSPSGALLHEAILSGSGRAATMDFATDGCTILYGSPGSPEIGRWDACRRTALPPFVSLADVRRLRYLKDGTLLVATSSRLVRFDRAGKLIQEYAAIAPAAEFVAFSVSSDGTSVWIAAGDRGAGSRFFRMALLDGSVLQGPFAGPRLPITALAAPDDWRAATSRAKRGRPRPVQ